MKRKWIKRTWLNFHTPHATDTYSCIMDVPNAVPYSPWNVTMCYVTWLKFSFREAFRCISECGPPGLLLHYVDRDAVSAANERSLEETMALIQRKGETEEDDEYHLATYKPRHHLVQWWRDHVIGHTLKRYISVGMTIIVLSEESRGIPEPVPRLLSACPRPVNGRLSQSSAFVEDDDGDCDNIGIDPLDTEYTERRRIMSDWTDPDMEGIWAAVMDVPATRPTQTYLVAGLDPPADTHDQAYWKKIRGTWEDKQRSPPTLKSSLSSSSLLSTPALSQSRSCTPHPIHQTPLPRPFIWRAHGEGEGSSGIDTGLWTVRVGPLSGMLTHVESAYPEASIMVSAESPRYLINAIVGELLAGSYRASNNRLGTLPRLHNLQFDTQHCGISGGDRLLPRVLCGAATNHRGARQAFFAPVAMLSALGMLSGRTTVPWGGGMELWTQVKMSTGMVKKHGIPADALPPAGMRPTHAEGYVWSDLWLTAMEARDLDAFSDMCRMEWPASAADAVHMAFIMLQDPIHRGVYVGGSGSGSSGQVPSQLPVRTRPPVLVDVVRYIIATCACICWNSIEGKAWMEERTRAGDLPVSARAISVWLRAACVTICRKGTYEGVMTPLETALSTSTSASVITTATTTPNLKDTDAEWEDMEEIIETDDRDPSEDIIEIIEAETDEGGSTDVGTVTKTPEKRGRSSSLEGALPCKSPDKRAHKQPIPRADQGLQFVSTPKQLHCALRIEARRLQWALNYVDYPVSREYPDPPSRYEVDSSGLSVWGWSRSPEDATEHMPHLSPYETILRVMGCVTPPLPSSSSPETSGEHIRVADVHHPYGRQLLWAYDDIGPLPYA